MNLSDKAQKWRKTTPNLKGGVIIFNRRGIVQGWCNALRDPHHWTPGCIAVDEQGRQWKTVGGNNQDGAERWEVIVN